MIRSPAFRLKKHSETQIVAKIAKSGKSNREWEQGYSDTLLGACPRIHPHPCDTSTDLFVEAIVGLDLHLGAHRSP